MNKNALLRFLCVIVVIVALGCLPGPIFAQRGGGGHGGGGGFHGGGGGFHGGGGGFHAGGGGFHSGGGGFHSSVGGFHGGGGGFRGSVGGFRGGRSYGYGGGRYGGYNGRGYFGGRGGYGWRGRGWGYPGYGWGWGLGFGLGWGWPYWDAYDYGYNPGWGYSYPYNYPYCAPGYECPYYGDYGDDDPPSSDYRPQSWRYGAPPSRRPAAEAPSAYSPGDTDYDSGRRILSIDRIAAIPENDPVVDSAGQQQASARVLSAERITATPSSYHVAMPAKRHDSALRPEMQNAMRALHEMPPFAREREIATGRYSQFSPQEKKVLRSVS